MIVEARALTKFYGGRAVLRGVDAQVSEGETIALVGPSGAGKSTFLRCLNGLVPFDSGELRVAGLSLAPRTPAADASLLPLRARVGMVFQGFHLFPHLSARDNIALAPIHVRAEAPAEAHARAQELLARVGLGDRGDARPAQLSGGQQQRVAIARALAMRPAVLLLDEPTSALDPQMRAEVLAVLRSVAGTCTMLVVTHEMSFALGVASRVWVFDDGRIVEDGPPAQVRDHPHSECARAFFRDTRR